MDYSMLIQSAISAMEKSYAPYSFFRVGASLLTTNGRMFSGCNIENSSYSPTICAERCAFVKAISEGETSFAAIAVLGGKNGEITDYIMPCGVCRQFMAEFCGPTFKVICWNGQKSMVYTLRDLLPYSFSKNSVLGE